MRRRDSGVTLVEIAAAVTMLGIVVALLVPTFVRSSRLEKVLACQGHFRTLHQADQKAPAPDARQVGGLYWMRLATAKPPLVEPDVLLCPLVEEKAACHYLGPIADPATLDAKHPIGSDSDRNHSDDGKQGGNVLLKSGEVVTDHSGIWAAAVRQGKCRP
jgi:hypothetical protein